MSSLKEKTKIALIWSQKYTKTDMIYLAKGSFWLNSGKVITIVSIILLGIAFANLLPKDTYGIYSYVISFVTILSIPTLVGINNSLLRSVAKGNEATIKTSLKERIKWGTFTSIISTLLSCYYFLNNNQTLAISFLTISLLIPLASSLDIWKFYLNGKKKFKDLSIFETSVKIVNVIILITTLLLTDNIYIILFTNFSSIVLLNFIFLKFTLKKYPPNKKIDNDSINYGKHLSAMNALRRISEQIDKVLMFHFLGAIELAVYSFAIKPIQELQTPLKSLGELSSPKFSQRKISELKKSLLQKIIKFIFLLIPIVILYIIIAPFIFQLLLPKYIASIFYSQLYSLSILLFPRALIKRALVAHHKKKELYILDTTIPILKIILLLLMIPVYGILGAIITLLTTQTLDFILLIFLFKKTAIPTTSYN